LYEAKAAYVRELCPQERYPDLPLSKLAYHQDPVLFFVERGVLQVAVRKVPTIPGTCGGRLPDNSSRTRVSALVLLFLEYVNFPDDVVVVDYMPVSDSVFEQLYRYFV
jgi:hypothetical protein